MPRAGRGGQVRVTLGSVARLISLVEDASPLLREVMAGLAPYAGSASGSGSGAHVVGLTGPPGVGK